MSQVPCRLPVRSVGAMSKVPHRHLELVEQLSGYRRRVRAQVLGRYDLAEGGYLPLGAPAGLGDPRLPMRRPTASPQRILARSRGSCRPQPETLPPVSCVDGTLGPISAQCRSEARSIKGKRRGRLGNTGPPAPVSWPPPPALDALGANHSAIHCRREPLKKALTESWFWPRAAVTPPRVKAPAKTAADPSSPCH
jgi:hypothetical protein